MTHTADTALAAQLATLDPFASLKPLQSMRASSVGWALRAWWATGRAVIMTRLANLAA